MKEKAQKRTDTSLKQVSVGFIEISMSEFPITKKE